jgi:HEAT repeat protein
MRRALLLTLVAASAALGPARQAFAQGPSFFGRPMRDWLTDLKDPKPEVRRGAAFALGKVGGDAGPGTGQVIDALTHSVADKDPGVRDCAASGLGDVLTALGEQGPAYWAKVGSALQTALKDGEPRVRRSAAYALGAFGPAAAPARDDLIAATADPSAIVRQNAAYALGKLGEKSGAEGVAELRKLLKDDEPLVRRDALHALGDVGNPTGHPAVSAMLTAAGSESNAVVRKAAVEALSRLVGPEDHADAAALYPLLQDKDPETRYNAAFVLGKIGGAEAVEALPVLREALKDQDPHFQELAAASIGGLGKDAAPAVEDLGAALTGAKESVIRENAAVSLAHIGPSAAKALPQILQALQETDDARYGKVRVRAAEALQSIHMPGVEPAIPAVLKIIKSDPDPLVRQRCLWSLFDIRKLDQYGITPVLTEVLNETDPNATLVRYDSARLLALCLRDNAPDKTPDVLLDMLNNRSLYQFNGSTAHTSGVGTEGAGGKTQVNEAKGGDARYMAAEALGWLSRKANRPDVVKALETAAQDDDANLKAKAKEALGRIK